MVARVCGDLGNNVNMVAFALKPWRRLCGAHTYTVKQGVRS